MPGERILRMAATVAKAGISRSAIYNGIKAGTFPKPIQLGSPYAIGFLESEIDEWIAKQVRASRKESPLVIANAN